MSSLLESFGEALRLLAAWDRELVTVTLTSVSVSLAALLIALVLAVPIAVVLSSTRGITSRIASWLIHTLTALPTVGIGLFLYLLLSSSGPLGWMDLLYTRAAMVAGQAILATPIIAAFLLTALGTLPPEARETAHTLGMGKVRTGWLLVRESASELRSAAMIAFARVFTEVGAAIILGGNIRGETRVLTTVIALEHNRGDDARAIALGLVLIAIALLVNGVVRMGERP